MPVRPVCSLARLVLDLYSDLLFWLHWAFRIQGLVAVGPKLDFWIDPAFGLVSLVLGTPVHLISSGNQKHSSYFNNSTATYLAIGDTGTSFELVIRWRWAHIHRSAAKGNDSRGVQLANYHQRGSDHVSASIFWD